MSLRKLPIISNFAALEEFDDEVPTSDALKRWTPGIALANEAPAGATTINIFDVIGPRDEFFAPDAVGTAEVAAALEGATGDVVVNINSPGGSFFHGISIYTLLAQYPGKVIVNNLGLAASAAAIVMMAGDERNIADAGQIMIHNVQSVTVGDRHDHEDAIGVLENLDQTLAEVFANATGQKERTVADWMDAETWFNATKAVDLGFASAKLDTKSTKKTDAKNAGEVRAFANIRRVQAILKESGMSRSQQREHLNAIRGGKPRAVDPGERATQDAGLSELTALTRELTSNVKEGTIFHA